MENRVILLLTVVIILISISACQPVESVEPLVGYDVIYSTMEVCLAGQAYLPTVTPQSSVEVTSEVPDEINVLFIGGSITAGTGASSYDKSYVSLVTSWLNQNIQAKVNVKNLAIGGTGSDYAAYRLEHDLRGFVPDITFYEFAVNDDWTDYDYIQNHVEIMLTKLLFLNPEMRIISIITTSEKLGSYYEDHSFSPATYAHIDTATRNGVPIVFAGQDLWHHVDQNDLEIRDFLPDGTHPNDAGYQIYYESIVRYLESADVAMYFGTPTFASPPIGSVMDAIMTDFSNVETDGCTKFETNEKDISLHCNSGNSFSFEFSGPTLGFVREIRSDGGKLSCNIDDGESFTIDFWDRYSLTYDRSAPVFIKSDLEDNSHNLTCTVLEEKPEMEGVGGSEGNVVNLQFILTQ